MTAIPLPAQAIFFNEYGTAHPVHINRCPMSLFRQTRKGAGKMNRHARCLMIAAVAIGGVFLWSDPASAHCDGLDGPVVTAARKALESADPNAVLIWVNPADEQVIRTAFRETLAVRRLSPQARELADHYFFETLVRLHRAGEGAPYTGLQPAGRDLGPAIALADKAVASGSDKDVLALISTEVSKGIHGRFEGLKQKRQFDPANLAAGREYVESYVAFIHYVEAVHTAAQSSAEGHYAEAPKSPEHH